MADQDQDLYAPTGPMQPRGMVAPPGTPTGATGPMSFVQAPIAGALGAASNIASAVQGGAKIAGMDPLADAAGQWAQRRREQAATFTAPEEGPWYAPGNLARTVLRGAPAAVGGLAAAALAPEAAGVLGAGAAATAAFAPLMFGQNIETSEAVPGQEHLTKQQAYKAAALAVPEAAAGAIPLGGALARGAEGTLTHAVTHASASMAVGSAAQDAIGQMMGDPNRPIASRMSEVLQSAVTGGVTGALVGGGVHAISKAPVAEVKPADLTTAIDQSLGSMSPWGQKALPPPAVTAGPPMQDMSPEEIIQRARQGQPDAIQEMMRRAGPPTPGEGPVPGEAVIPQPAQEDVDLRNQLVADQPRGAEYPTQDEIDAAVDSIRPTAEQIARAEPPIPGRHPVEGIPQPTEDDRALNEARFNSRVAEQPSLADTEHLPNFAQPEIETSEPPHPFADLEGDGLAAAVKKAAGTLPRWLDTTDYPSAVKSTIEKLNEETPTTNAQERIAKVLGVTEDTKLPEDTPTELPTAAPRDTIDPKHQARWDQAEALRDDAKTTPEATKALDTAQDMLADPKPGLPQQFAKAIKSVKDMIAGEQAKDVVAPDRPAPPAQPALLAGEPTPAAQAIAATTPAAKTAGNIPGGAAVKASLDNLRAMNVAPSDATPQEAASVNKLWKSSLKKDPTGLDLWDNHFDRISPAAQQALSDHGDLIENENGKQNPGTLFSLAKPQLVRTPQGLDIEHITNNGGSLKDSLDYLSKNGENGNVKAVANLLSRNGVDAKMRISDDIEHPDAVAQYAPDTNTVTLRPGQSNSMTVLHEAIHAATQKAINAMTASARVMQELYNTVKALSPAYGPTNLHEFTAEALSNSEYQDYLRSIPDPQAPKTSMWQSFKNAVARILGAKPGTESTMLDRVMETGNRLIQENQAKTGAGDPTPPLHKLNDKVRDFVAERGAIGEKLSDSLFQRLGDLNVGLQKTILAARNGRDIAQTLKALGVKSGDAIINARGTGEDRTNAYNKASMTAIRMIDKLPAADIAKLRSAAATTVLKLDPTKSAENQPADTREAMAKDPELYKRWTEGRRDYMSMSDAGRAAYDAMSNLRKMHQVAGVTTALDQYVKRNWTQQGLTKGFEEDPAAAYQFSNEAHSSPEFALDQWKQAMATRKAGLDEFIAKGQLTGKDGQPLPEHDALVSWSKKLDATLAGLDEPPNFHLSHGQGDFFVAGRLPLNVQGVPDPQAIAKLMPRLAAAGFGDRVLEASNENNGVYARVESTVLQDKLSAVFRQAAEDGLLDKEHGIKAGPAEESGVRQMQPAVLQSLIKAMRDNRPNTDGLDPVAKEQTDKAYDQHIVEIERQMMDALSDSSVSKVLATKEYVQGYTNKMDEAFREGAARSARMLANMSVSNDMSAGLAGVRDEMKALKGQNLPGNQILMAHNALNEILQRQAQKPLGKPSGLVSALKNISYKFELASPAYATLLMSQNLTLGLPKLGSRVSYVQAAKSYASATADSFRALRAAAMDGTGLGLRQENLEAAGLSPKLAKYMTKLDNMGLFNSSSQTHMVVPNEEEGSGTISKISKLSGAYTLAAEMQPRFHMALAALHAFEARGMSGDVYDFAQKMIRESAFEFNSATASRLQSRGGPLGELSPLLTQFSKFRTEVTTRLIRETMDAFSKTATPEDQIAARKFLLGHLAATTILAGTLGLPMVGMLASVYDKLADWSTGDPTHDITASYRGLLTTMFGASAGEAVARGAPRLIGADMGKAGESTVVPFISDALTGLTEKRKLEDAEKDWLKRVAGPSIGLAADWAFGLRDIANGDYLRGLAKMVPEGLRGPVEAAEIAKYGYRDKNGQPLKIEGQTLTPGAQDIIEKVFGIEPAKEQEYDEVARTASGLTNRLHIQGANIQQHLQQAYERGDQGNFAYWADQGGPQWMHDHPGVQPPVMAFQQALREHMIQNAMSLPAGVNKRDIVARGMVGYGNPH